MTDYRTAEVHDKSEGPPQSWAEYERDTQVMWDEARLATDEFVRSVAVPFWRYGDGLGGSVIQMLIEAMESHGLATKDARQIDTRAIVICSVCGGRRRVHEATSTYVVQRQRWVKIGRAKDLPARLRTLTESGRPGVLVPDGMDWATPLVVLKTFPRDYEHQLHTAFAHAHVTGEWFRAEPLLAWVGSGAPL